MSMATQRWLYDFILIHHDSFYIQKLSAHRWHTRVIICTLLGSRGQSSHHQSLDDLKGVTPT